MKIFLILLTPVVLLALILIIEAVIVSRGPREQFINPKRTPQVFGKSDNKLKYLVMGDSTGAGQGGDYDQGIAVSTAKNLSQNYEVEFLNASISGAKVSDVITGQLEEGLKFNPDLILISVGANDVVKLTNPSTFEKDLGKLISKIIESNCKTKIVVTGVPEMGAIPRFAQPLRYIAGLQTKNLNNVFDQIIKKYNLAHAPIAKITGPIFKKDKSLFAQDRFHPNNQGYAEWIKVINPVLENELKNPNSHCK